MNEEGVGLRMVPAMGNQHIYCRNTDRGKQMNWKFWKRNKKEHDGHDWYVCDRGHMFESMLVSEFCRWCDARAGFKA